MTQRHLPERPHLPQLKRQAKELLAAARRGDAEGLARFRILPAFAAEAPDPGALALHDAQSVLAREHGFDSWKALHRAVEAHALDDEAAAEAFVMAATEGQPDRAGALLADHPGLEEVSFHAALVLGDEDAAARHLAGDPALAVRPGGPRAWEAILYLCHASMADAPPTRDEGRVAIARRLLELGADPNTRFPWVHHGVRRPALWAAACVAELPELVEVLLEFGADPNDGVTLALASSTGNARTLELLRAHGADLDQPWATDGSASLYALLTWDNDPAGARWLVTHGANPDPAFEANGETPLHMVARRWDAPLAELLVEHGARVDRRRQDGRTPYAVALLSGNEEVATWLREHGSPTDLHDVDRLVAACVGGDLAGAEAILAADPSLRDRIGPAHYPAFYQIAEEGDATALRALLAAGFDPDRPDEEIGKTVLHAAAMAGKPASVRVLLEHGASVDVRDREFGGQPLVWAAEAARHHPERAEAYDEIARLLLEAGSPHGWEPGDEPAATLVEVLERWVRRYGRGQRDPRTAGP